MPYTGLAAPSYNKDRKRLAPTIIHRLDEVQAQILQDPHRGDRKRGALRHIWVEKFKVLTFRSRFEINSRAIAWLLFAL